jgi:hypothetical protein
LRARLEIGERPPQARYHRSCPCHQYACGGSANIDDRFFGWFTGALHTEDGETEIELEEAYFETLGLSAGITIRGGRFFSALGYLNNVHVHAQDFVDFPLVYRAFFGNQFTAFFAVIEELAGVGQHGLHLPVSTCGTGNSGLPFRSRGFVYGLSHGVHDPTCSRYRFKDFLHGA